MQSNPETDAEEEIGDKEVKISAGVDTDGEEIETPEL